MGTSEDRAMGGGIWSRRRERGEDGVMRTWRTSKIRTRPRRKRKVEGKEGKCVLIFFPSCPSMPSSLSLRPHYPSVLTLASVSALAPSLVALRIINLLCLLARPHSCRYPLSPHFLFHTRKANSEAWGAFRYRSQPALREVCRPLRRGRCRTQCSRLSCLQSVGVSRPSLTSALGQGGRGRRGPTGIFCLSASCCDSERYDWLRGVPLQRS